MILLKSVLLGIIEGVTEFLPISSTAHLIIAQKILQIPSNEYWKFFTVFIQSGAILAVIASYFVQLKDKQTLRNLFLSFVPTAIIGLLMYPLIKSIFFESLGLIVFMLIGFGLVFLVVERLIDKGKIKLKKGLKQMSIKEAVLIGLWQSLAIIPGASRAGAVIIGGLFMGFRRTDIALYSFFLAVPTILAASVLDIIKTKPNLLISNLLISITGFVVSFITAYFVLRWFISYLQKNDLRIFGYYRIMAGILLIILYFLYF